MGMQEWHGITVGDLISQLQEFDEHEPIVIQKDIGWNGVGYYEFEVVESEITKDGSDFYVGISTPNMRDAVVLRFA